MEDLRPYLPATPLGTEAERAKASLAEFIRQGWETVEPGTPLAWNWHIEAISKHLEAVTHGDIKRLIINIPPGHMKSLIVSVFWPAWEWLTKPEERSLFGSYAMDLSLRDSVRCRDLINSDWYQDQFQPDWRLKRDQKVKSYFVNSRLGFRFSMSTGGRVTGFRGHKWVMDDPLNVRESWSENARLNAINFIDKALSSRLNDPRSGARVIVMQRLHEQDPTGHLLAKGGWEHLCLPSEFDPERRSRTFISLPTGEKQLFWEDPRKDPGELLFPDFFTHEVLAESKKDLGETEYAGQHGQLPAPAEGIIFKKAWFEGRYRQTPKFVAVFSIWDTAMKDNQRNDESACITAGIGEDGNLYPLRVTHGRWETPKLADFLVAQTTWAKGVYGDLYTDYVEDKVSGTTLMQFLRRSHPEIAIVPIATGRESKEERAHGVTKLCEAGRVLLPDLTVYPQAHGWVGDLIGQLMTFPNGAHDDIVDVFVYACKKVLGTLNVKKSRMGKAGGMLG